MKDILKDFIKAWYGKTVLILFGLVLVAWLFAEIAMPSLFEWYTGVENAELTYANSVELSETEFNNLANELSYEAKLEKARLMTSGIDDRNRREEKIRTLINTPSFGAEKEFSHVKYFREAGIRQYKGPETCLECHETMKVEQADGLYEEVETLEDVVNTVHFQFQKMAAGFSTYGYNGKLVNSEGMPVPVGKIDRACGIPGSFSWTGWAALIETHPEGSDTAVMRSEGCGQCHIGGNYHPATEMMLPFGEVPETAKQGIDCLICHSQTYDMNYRHVIEDENGTRWNQDRTLKAALTVSNPTNDNCLYCHQHNLGGDVYEQNVAAKNLGYENQRILHEGSKRGNPFSEQHDVHAAMGMLCLDCHEPQGHKIPRGNMGTDLVANDLPGTDVSCANCHTEAPHTKDGIESVMLNGHTKKLACETCHIHQLEETNVVLRDWTNPTWNEEEGIYTPTDILHSGEANIGFTFLWFNGTGTFLANALGNNPNGSDSYNPLMDQITKIDNPEAVKEIRENIEKMLADRGIDIDEYMESFINTLSQLPDELLQKRIAMINNSIKPLQNRGNSKIYPFKLFNARMYEDMSNSGPFGAMILPFDYNVYYETGNALNAVKKAISTPIVKRMYERPFKEYMMDDFMEYFGVDEWSDEYPIGDDGELRNVEPKWMRQYGTLMINHGVQAEGRTCNECHSENGILDFEGLGYTPERASQLKELPEINFFTKK